MRTDSAELLQRGAAELGFDISPHLGQFAELLRLLQEGNARLNLTALKTERDIVLKHFVDSLSCLRGGYLDDQGRLLDLGTGAGFPSLPLAILRPTLQIHPLDATRKKIEFVRATAQELGLANINPLVGRAEGLGRQPEHREQYDRVVARAVAALPILVELALPLLRQHGVLIAQKGQLETVERQAGERAALELGGQLEEIEEFALPVLGDTRSLVIIRKLHPTPQQYPRREGIPNQHPLFWKSK